MRRPKPPRQTSTHGAPRRSLASTFLAQTRASSACTHPRPSCDCIGEEDEHHKLAIDDGKIAPPHRASNVHCSHQARGRWHIRMQSGGGGVEGIWNGHHHRRRRDGRRSKRTPRHARASAEGRHAQNGPDRALTPSLRSTPGCFPITPPTTSMAPPPPRHRRRQPPAAGHAS